MASPMVQKNVWQMPNGDINFGGGTMGHIGADGAGFYTDPNYRGGAEPLGLGGLPQILPIDYLAQQFLQKKGVKPPDGSRANWLALQAARQGYGRQASPNYDLSAGRTGVEGAAKGLGNLITGIQAGRQNRQQRQEVTGIMDAVHQQQADEQENYQNQLIAEQERLRGYDAALAKQGLTPEQRIFAMSDPSTMQAVSANLVNPATKQIGLGGGAQVLGTQIPQFAPQFDNLNIPNSPAQQAQINMITGGNFDKYGAAGDAVAYDQAGVNLKKDTRNLQNLPTEIKQKNIKAGQEIREGEQALQQGDVSLLLNKLKLQQEQSGGTDPASKQRYDSAVKYVSAISKNFGGDLSQMSPEQRILFNSRLKDLGMDVPSNFLGGGAKPIKIGTGDNAVTGTYDSSTGQFYPYENNDPTKGVSSTPINLKPRR